MADEKTFTQAQVDEMTKGMFTQEALNHHVQERLGREKERTSNYDDLVKFKAEHEKKASAQEQIDLENAKKYDEAKGTMGKQIKDLQDVLTAKDGVITGMKINHTLVSELAKSNAYIDESVAMMVRQAVVDESGAVKITGKDSNNLDIKYSVEEGVKKFLEQRPHLVKANNKGGGGTPPGTPPGGTPPTNDLVSLTLELSKAISSSDHKGTAEARKNLNAAFKAKGINRQV